MLKYLHIKLLLILISFWSHAQIKWPAVTNTCKPWTRWWWQGSAVTKSDLTWNLEEYKKAGLGGVEITPIYGVYGYEKQFINYLSPEWMNMLDHTLAEAKRLRLGVDLANATGWPFGGPWVTDDDASKTFICLINDTLGYNRPALIRTANNKILTIDSVLKPLSVNKNLQSLALDQIQFPEKLTPQYLIKANGNTYSFYEMLHGKMVERAAPGGEGYAIDHFSATAARNYFKKFDEAFKGHDLSYLRGFFNDSYEVDDARGQANWTSNMFEEFKKRRGYDLKDHIGGLLNNDRRVLYDYRSTIDELILENFTQEWQKWGKSKGKILRNQSHGSPANTLDLYSVVDIPETEGNDILRFKFASSAANVTGKKLVSAEAATWLNEHFLSSWGDVKKAIDLYFLGGINHIVYHGTAYSPKDAPWPGWLFYAAVHFQPTNPQWKDFHKLNEYVTRVQSFLQQGWADNKILLYYPIADRYSDTGRTLLQHFDGMERNFEKTDFEYVSKWMLEKGYGFDFFSDRQLTEFTTLAGMVVTKNNLYDAIVLPANKLIPVETMNKLLLLAQTGAKIIFYKHFLKTYLDFINWKKDVPPYLKRSRK